MWRAKKKKKKKKVLSSFSYFSLFHFSTFPFSIFLLFCSNFSFFLASLFPIGQQKIPGQKSLGALYPLPHPAPCHIPACYTTTISTSYLHVGQLQFDCIYCTCVHIFRHVSTLPNIKSSKSQTLIFPSNYARVELKQLFKLQVLRSSK